MFFHKVALGKNRNNTFNQLIITKFKVIMMPSFSEIEEENNSKNTIIKYLKEYHENTNRNVILYYSKFLTKDNDDVYIDSIDKNGFMTIIKDLDKTKGLDIILHTPGGSIDATESLIDYLHAVFGDDIKAIIPQMAMSGGTMIACSCNEIIMGKHSSLDPVDPQIIDVSAQTVIEEYDLAKKEISEDPSLIPIWTMILDKYPTNFYFECKNTMEWSKNILKKSLKYSMFKDNDEETINHIIHELISREATKNHSQNLSAKKCEEIGLNITYLEEDEIMQDLVLSIHHACISYFNHENGNKIYINQNGTFLSLESEI